MTHRRRLVATVFSVGLHVIALLLLLPSLQSAGPSPGGSLGDGYGRGDGVDLTLYDFAQPPAGAPEAKPAENLEELAQLDVAEPVQDPVFELATIEVNTPPSLTRSDVAATAESTADIETAANNGTTGANGNAKGASDELWKMIEPCWRRLADSSTSGVTLQVTFSALGNPVTPPVVKRPPGTFQNDRATLSESQAVAALSECGPYLFAYGQEGVEINFPPLSHLASAGI